MREALELWRGEPFADARDLSSVTAQIAHLRELRLGAIEQLADAQLAARRERQPRSTCSRDATHDAPLQERLTAQLMLALYRSGRQADALNAFRVLQRNLDESLGLPPSAALRQLEEDIIFQRVRLDLARPGDAPVDRGERPLSRGGRFVGRRLELDRLALALDAAASGERRLVLLSGPAGVGKTATADTLLDRASRPRHRHTARVL